MNPRQPIKPDKQRSSDSVNDAVIAFVAVILFLYLLGMIIVISAA